jgi:hypothetical protein
MKLTPMQIQKLVEKVIAAWKKQNVIHFKEDEKKVVERALKAVREDYQREVDLEMEVNKMLEDLERKNPGSFQRGKMFHMLKQKLAAERKIIL